MAGQPDELLTIEEVIAELRVPRSIFFRWREQGIGPRAMRAAQRHRADPPRRPDEWLRGLEDDPKEHAA